MSYTIKIPDILLNIADAFKGQYSYNEDFLNQIREDIFDISVIPDLGDDRKNLKMDIDIFLKDSKKAEKAIKEGLKNGKTK